MAPKTVHVQASVHLVHLFCFLGTDVGRTKSDVMVKSTSFLESHSHFLSLSSKQSVPGQSSTPLVRSSERLAAKRRTQDGGSLETLYFTPMVPQGKKRVCANQDHKLESSITSLGELTLDSARKPSSSVQRRRTTQVINITMTKVGQLQCGKYRNVHCPECLPRTLKRGHWSYVWWLSRSYDLINVVFCIENSPPWRGRHRRILLQPALGSVAAQSGLAQNSPRLSRDLWGF